jgi:hypothetical protein
VNSFKERSENTTHGEYARVRGGVCRDRLAIPDARLVAGCGPSPALRAPSPSGEEKLRRRSTGAGVMRPAPFAACRLSPGLRPAASSVEWAASAAREGGMPWRWSWAEAMRPTLVAACRPSPALRAPSPAGEGIQWRLSGLGFVRPAFVSVSGARPGRSEKLPKAAKKCHFSRARSGDASLRAQSLCDRDKQTFRGVRMPRRKWHAEGPISTAPGAIKYGEQLRLTLVVFRLMPRACFGCWIPVR